MKKDRQLIKLANGKLSVEKLAHMLDSSPPQIVKSRSEARGQLETKTVERRSAAGTAYAILERGR
jgi:hypothetical protein